MKKFHTIFYGIRILRLKEVGCGRIVITVNDSGG